MTGSDVGGPEMTGPDMPGPDMPRNDMPGTGAGEWRIERLGRRGDGVAVPLGGAGGRALAAMTLPGEVIAGEVTARGTVGREAVGGGAAGGVIAAPRILSPSPDRVRAPCPHYRTCGGCALMHASDPFVAGWKAEIVRGEADARRNAIYAAAFGRDPEFFAFTRSMTSYERALRGENSSLVIQPEGEFFDYLKSDGAERANPVPAAAAAALSVVAPAPAVVPAATEADVPPSTARNAPVM